METVTQLQETYLLSAPLYVWRQEGTETEVNHMFSCEQRNRMAWCTPIPEGFTVRCA